MPFTLVYQGQLKPRQRTRNGEGAAALRGVFHPQLQERFEYLLKPGLSSQVTEVDGCHYMPIVHARHGIAADIEVTLLAPHGLRAGDADNRMKALLDGLTRPANPQQVGPHDSTDPTQPTFCVLDDDKLVNRLTVDARPWYGREPGDTASLAVINVTVRANGQTTIWSSAVIG